MKPEQSTLHIVSANLRRWIGPRLPEDVVESAREYLRVHDTSRRLRGSWVMVFGDDMHLHLTTFNCDFPGGEGAEAYAYALAKGAAPAYDEARERAYRLNKTIWDAHGGNFSPVGVDVSKVEKTYPLAKMIARITAKGSPYELQHSDG